MKIFVRFLFELFHLNLLLKVETSQVSINNLYEVKSIKLQTQKNITPYVRPYLIQTQKNNKTHSDFKVFTLPAKRLILVILILKININNTY